MAINPTGSGSCTTCSDTRTVNVSFTAPTPAPASGYIVKWKKTADADSTYTQVTPNPTSSPVTISNVPACDSITVSVQANCGGSNISSASLTTIAGIGYKLKCSCGFAGTYTSNDYYQYPTIPIDFTGASNGAQISVSYDGVDRPNRFTIYNETDGATTATSGWVGEATYSGPWGSTVSVNAGILTFTYNSAKTYSLKVEAGPADTGNPISDSWNVLMSCAGALSCALGTLTVAEFVPTPGQNGLLYSSNRFVFSSTSGGSCAAGVSAAYYLPDPNSVFGVLSVFQDAAGTQPFTLGYVRDRIGDSWTAPTAVYNYNTSTGAVGSYVSSCL